MPLSVTSKDITPDYYVDPVSGNDANNGTTAELAFATIGAAVTAVGSAGGKTVSLVDGSYGAITISTAFSAETTFVAQTTHGAIFETLAGTGLQNCTFIKIRVHTVDTVAYTDPDSAPVVVSLENPSNLTFLSCRFGSTSPLRARRVFYTFSTTSTKAVSVVLRDCIIENGAQGVRWAAGGTDCVVRGCTIRHLVSTPLGNQGLGSTGLDYSQNEIYDVFFRPDDPEWTVAPGAETSGYWSTLHRSLLSVRDTIGLTFDDNLIYSIENPWMQFYAGEFGNIYDYGDISIKRNLVYDSGAGVYSLLLQATDTTRSGPIQIEQNTFVNTELPDWDAASYTSLSERFGSPTFNAASFGDFQAGDTSKNNLLIGRVDLPVWSNNNVGWWSPLGSPGTDNIYVRASHNADPDWVTDQLVVGTWVHAVSAEGTIRAGYTFTPAIGSTLATAGEGGTYVGATAPA